jgi:AraC-like DNA-binding protein
MTRGELSDIMTGMAEKFAQMVARETQERKIAAQAKLMLCRKAIDSRDQVIMTAWDAGVTVSDIAAIIGLSRQYVHDIIRRENAVAS